MRYVESENITPEKIFAEEPVQWAITTPLYNIGKHAVNLTEEFRKQHPNISWIRVAGLRHRLVHYANCTVICSIIFDILPSFLEDLKGIWPTP